MFGKHYLQGTLPKRSSECALEQELFQPDSEYVSYLSFKGDRWIREDYCLSCWKKIEEAKKRDGGNYWIGKIPLELPKKISPDAKALELFRKSVESGDNPKLVYILALYLERKKQLAKRSKVEGDQSSYCFEIPETGEVFLVKFFLLSEEEGDALAIELSNRLSKEDE